MLDNHGRRINYLRLSVTDKCNYRCVYCLPRTGVKKKQKSEILTFEEISKLVKACSNIGISKVRLTGGEPLQREGLVELVKMISETGVEDLSLTTNGSGLAEKAPLLKRAGLDRVNVSLDSLDPEGFSQITRGGDLGDVLNGIEEATAVGLEPVKINSVPIEKFNEDEIHNLVRYAQKNDLILRFIGLMPMGEVAKDGLKGISLEKLNRILNDSWQLTPIRNVEGAGPAQYFVTSNRFQRGRIGLIYPRENRFCSDCNKIRITADGMLRPCLGHDTQYPLGEILNRPLNKICKTISSIISKKPEKHPWGKLYRSFGEMSSIGG